MSFATVINCMDGRTQTQTNTFLCARFDVDYIDTITEPGPIKILAETPSSPEAESIINRLNISVYKHGSTQIAIVAHHDCAGNPEPADVQFEQLQLSIAFVKDIYPDVEVIGLWIGDDWQVVEQY